MHEHCKNFNKDIENIKMYQREIMGTEEHDNCTEKFTRVVQQQTKSSIRKDQVNQSQGYQK